MNERCNDSWNLFDTTLNGLNINELTLLQLHNEPKSPYIADRPVVIQADKVTSMDEILFILNFYKLAILFTHAILGYRGSTQ